MMFLSNCTANELINRVQNELGYANAPDRDFFYTSLNDSLARIYAELISEKRRFAAEAAGVTVDLSAITPQEGCAPTRGADVSAVWSGDRQLRFLPYSMLSLGGKGYYTVAGDLLILGDGSDGADLSVEAVLRPARFTEESGDGCIPFPDEFLSLLACRMRGEALRLSGEDGEAAKWLGEYNTLLEEFSGWLAALYGRRKG